LIIALGLLVDVPVVAGDGIKRGLAAGLSRDIAAWLGPPSWRPPIFFATLTNIIAYLPFSLCSPGTPEEFLRSLPIGHDRRRCCGASGRGDGPSVPLLGYYIQRSPKKKELTVGGKSAKRRFSMVSTTGLVGRAIQHRWLGGWRVSFLFFAGLAGGRSFAPQAAVLSRRTSQYWFYPRYWLPNDVPLTRD